MYSARPYGRFSSKELSDEDNAAIERLARIVTNQKSVSMLGSMKRVITLPSGKYASATDMGGTFRIVVYEKDQPPEEILQEGLAQPFVPMLFSGVITASKVNSGENGLEKEGVGIKLTEQCRLRIANYKPDKKPKKDVRLHRFAIPYSYKFNYFEPKLKTSGLIYTQYDKQRPTWYSGAMTEVMQITGGYGIQNPDYLPEDELEFSRMTVPEKTYEDIELELINARLPGYLGVPSEGGQFNYDYKFHSCNAVSFGLNGLPWLLDISVSGVYAMPLPMIPATLTKAFREYVEETGDSELQLAIDRFGGLPSGEGFPVGEDREAWRRAGVVIKLCDTEEFYQGSAFYEACGWSFNSKGNEGYNTCWTVGENNLVTSRAFKMRVEIGSLENNGWMPLKWETASPEEGRALDNYLSKLYQDIGVSSDKARAIKYKLRRLTAKQILAHAGSESASSAKYWDALEMEPVTECSATITQVASGPLPFSAEPGQVAGIKFPEIAGLGCESILIGADAYEGPDIEKFDTIVFGCYVDDSLKVIRYFRDKRKYQRKETGSMEGIMIVGSWDKTVTTGLSGISGSVYTSDSDDRQTISPSVESTRIVGRDLGYSSPDYWKHPHPLRDGIITRSRYWEHETTIEKTNGFRIEAAALVPVFARDCISYVYKQSKSSWSTSTKTTMHGAQDPNWYEFWTNDFYVFYVGTTLAGLIGSPYPSKGERVFVDGHYHLGGGAYNEFADAGEWLGFSPPYMDITGTVGAFAARAPRGKAPSWRPFASYESKVNDAEGRFTITVKGASGVIANRKIPEEFYFDFSPELSGAEPSYLYKDATWIAFGDAAYSTSSEVGDNGKRLSWGDSKLANRRSSQHFIGVINE